jgi:hypothetical protein
VTKFDAELDDSIQKSATQELMENIEMDEAKQELEEVVAEKPAKRKYKKRK